MSTNTRITMFAICLILTAGFNLAIAEMLVPDQAPVPVRTASELSDRSGFVAPNIDLSHLANRQPPARFSTVTAPARWDCRAEGKVT